MNNDLEKLKRIRAKCVELLSIAEKRTPGEWRCYSDGSFHGLDIRAADKGNEGSGVITAITDATFIASCAGSAEAAWRSTIAAIDGLTESASSWSPTYGGHSSELDAFNTLHTILSAWPEELLK